MSNSSCQVLRPRCWIESNTNAALKFNTSGKVSNSLGLGRILWNYLSVGKWTWDVLGTVKSCSFVRLDNKRKILNTIKLPTCTFLVSTTGVTLTEQSGNQDTIHGTLFSAPVQNGPGAHPASYTMGTGSLSRGVKRPGRGVNHPPASSAEVKERVELYLHSLSWSLLM